MGSKLRGVRYRIGHTRRLSALGASLGCCLVLSSCSSDEVPEPAANASDALVWGYPLVVSERTFQTLAKVIGINQLFNQSFLATARLRFIVAPNQDTLYSVAVLDLRSEPMVLSVPDAFDRYWGFQFLDAWTNSFHYIGTRATGGKGGSFAITAPGWAGSLPNGVERIEAPTPQLFLLGRYLFKSEADVPNVNALERTLSPLHEWTGGVVPSALPAIGEPPGTAQAAGENGAAFFDELGDALAINPPASESDRRALSRFAALGVGLGAHPAQAARGGSDSARLAALDAGAAAGLQQIERAAQGTPDPRGWVTHLDIGVYPDDVLLRAAVAKFAWAANVPQESVYAVTRADESGEAYSGTHRYRLHFAQGELPPVSAGGFWSVTLYGPDMFFVDNSLGRYAIGDRTPGLQRNPDGSLDLYIQNNSPAGRESNWLPAPASEFLLMMRLFLPDQRVLDGKYQFPAVTTASE